MRLGRRWAIGDEPAVGIYELPTTTTVDAVAYAGLARPSTEVGSARPNRDAHAASPIGFLNVNIEPECSVSVH